MSPEGVDAPATLDGLDALATPGTAPETTATTSATTVEPTGAPLADEALLALPADEVDEDAAVEAAPSVEEDRAAAAVQELLASRGADPAGPDAPVEDADAETDGLPVDPLGRTDAADRSGEPTPAEAAAVPSFSVLFQAPDEGKPRRRRATRPAGSVSTPAPSEPAPAAQAGDPASGRPEATSRTAPAVTADDVVDTQDAPDETTDTTDTTERSERSERTDDGDTPRRSRRRRGGKGRRGRGQDDATDRDEQDDRDERDERDGRDDTGPQGSEVTDTTGDAETGDTSGTTDDSDSGSDSASETGGGRGRSRRRRSGGERAERSNRGDAGGDRQDDEGSAQGDRSDRADDERDETTDDESASTRRRRRRRRAGGSGDAGDDSPNVTTRVRQPRGQSDEPVAVKGSTRLEAKKQRRREGREAGRRRTIITEAEFLARREAVDRVMVVRNKDGRTQMGVLEDGVLVEHYIDQATSVSMAGNIYLGRVQNVLPSMEAAFVDIGKGRNAVLYAGEVNWDAAGLESNQPKRIENALSSGQSVLVQVTKDPIGHKGARLTSQISLPGRYLVYVPNSSMTGISRKLPDTERARLKKILRDVVPDTAGVIVRTAAEGASEDELRADVERLTATWEQIQAQAEEATTPRAGKSKGRKKNGASGSAADGKAPMLLHGEPDLTVRVIRDVFNEDFRQLVVAGDQAWEEIHPYISSVAPDLADRVTQWTGPDDLFTHHRVDEQLAKAMDRKVWLPSGGSLVIDRTEAMTVVDVNTGKFVGSGGNLEETVTKNNIEAAEEIVRQLRLRDIGGIIVVDFIDMVLESNRDLVVRRLLECLGRDRTKHQVAEVTSLGLVQMTRKRVGSGLIEVFGETCEHCNGRGFIIHSEPVDKGAHPAPSASSTSSSSQSSSDAGGARGRRGGRSGQSGQSDDRSGGQHGNGQHGNGQHGNGAHGNGQQGGADGQHGNGQADRTESSRPATGPTAAQIAAAAHAAALKTAALTATLESGTGGDHGDHGAEGAQGAEGHEQSFPDDTGPWSGVDAPAPGTADEPVSARIEGATLEQVDVEQGESARPEPVHQPEPTPAQEPVQQTEPEPVPTPVRGRRKRGRVVAPAGPPGGAVQQD
nr:Rne/Rng family ribonuclease [Terracoccus luteus]